MIRRSLIPVCALAAAACTSPNVDEYQSHTGIVQGTVLYPSGKVRGNAIVFLFKADDPPPPEGSGSPVSFVVVSAHDLFHDIPAGVPGTFAAPFTIPTVPPGTYQIRAFLDSHASFNPTIDLLNQPTAGDVGGGYVDPATAAFLPVTVAMDQSSSEITVVLGVNILDERPAFAITSTPSITVPFATFAHLQITAHPIRRSVIDMDPTRTRFRVEFVDENHDGIPDDKNGDHLPDVYPLVLLERTDPVDPLGTIIVPCIVDPYPYLDRIAATGSATTSVLEAIVPPVAIQRGASGDQLLDGIPPGTYAVIVVSGAGQTWQVPNALDTIDTTAKDPTQGQSVAVVEGVSLHAGRIHGSVSPMRGTDGYAFVFAATDPPPPAGTGRPITAAAIASDGAFLLSGLADGTYIVVAVVDPEGLLSPLDELVAQPAANDWVGTSTAVVVGGASRVTISLQTQLAFDRPSFTFDPISLPRTALPAELALHAHAVSIPRVQLSADSVRVPVTLSGGDLDMDNLPDLYPRVLLSRMSDAPGDPRELPDDPAGIVIPGIVDPIPFLGLLASGARVIPASDYGVILPPLAVRFGVGGAMQLISPPPAGRYRVNVLSATGQTWSVPSDLDVILSRLNGRLEDGTQSRFVRIDDAAVPGGVISGDVQIPSPPPAGAFEVVVLAFDKSHPPPPLGSGTPFATAIVPKAAFTVQTTASFTLTGLPTGTYNIHAFLDANHDFVPWFGTMNQPNAGDFGGGALMLPQPVFKDVNVDALGAPTQGVMVQIVSSLAIPFDRPAFGLPESGLSLSLAAGPLQVALSTVTAVNDLIQEHGVFPIQWVDLDGDGMADDINQDGQPDVFPIVVAELLDPMDATNMTVSSMGVKIPGFVSPAQFAPLGFPAADPHMVQVIVPAFVVHIVFPPVAIDASGHPVAPPPGRYRITMINPLGQTWTVPNELQRAAGTPLVHTQSGFLKVVP
jgi:hypothetical protein